MDCPIVSAIITTHNRKKLVWGAINSVLTQSYYNIELIVVDDCSNDGSKEYLADLADKYNFKYIYINEQSSHGGNYARNCGIEASNGKYIAFLDDDDEWLKNKIEKQVEILENNINVAVVYCGAILEFDFDKRVYNEASLYGDMSNRIWYNLMCTTSQLMIRKSVLDNIGGFDVKLKYWQEHELLIRLCQISNVTIVPDCLILYRISTYDTKKLSNNVDGWEETVKYIEQKHRKYFEKLSEDEIKKYNSYKALDGVQRSLKAKNKKLKRHYLKIIYKNDPNIKTLIKYVFNITNKNELLGKLVIPK